MVLLAFVLVRTVPWIDTNDASQVFRAEVIDQDRFFVRDNEVTTLIAKLIQGGSDLRELISGGGTLELIDTSRYAGDVYPIASAGLQLRHTPTLRVAGKMKVNLDQ